MKLIYILVACASIAFSGCKLQNKVKSDFQKFYNQFPLISFPFILNERSVLKTWDQARYIDTNFVAEYGLTDKYLDKENPRNGLSDYKCAYVGKYDAKNFVVLMYKLYTNHSDNGNPKLVLATFNRDGIKVDEIIALWSEKQSDLNNYNTILNLQDNRQIEVKSILIDYGYLHGEKVMKKNHVKIQRYEMNKDGKIISLQGLNQDMFKDDNPEIRDTQN